jgi:hypothetical protein
MPLEVHLLAPQASPFLLTVALCVAGIAALAFLFVALASWVQRHFAARFKELGSRKHP